MDWWIWSLLMVILCKACSLSDTLTCVIGWVDGCAHKRLIILPAGGCKHAKELIRWLHADGAQTFQRPSSPQHIRCTSIYPERTHNHLMGTRLSDTSINAITPAWGDVGGDSKNGYASSCNYDWVPSVQSPFSLRFEFNLNARHLGLSADMAALGPLPGVTTSPPTNEDLPSPHSLSHQAFHWLWWQQQAQLLQLK